MEMEGKTPNGRNGSACELCHRRKIRCDMHTGLYPCSHCRSVNQQCVPHRRKRKHDPVPERSSFKRPNIRPSASSPSTSSPLSGPGRTVGVGISETSASIETEPSPGSYLGRAEYVSGTVPIDEEDAKKYSSGRTTCFSDEDQRHLHDLKVFDLPPRSVYESLISSFMEHCYPWMPIVEPHELHPSDNFQPSILLLYSVFVAGSRVSLAPHAQADGRTYYRRAKALYHLGYEKEPLTIVRSVCLLLWYNNSGPEHISLDASSYWVHMGVALANQCGLHREPASKTHDAKLRRRIWWTLFLRDCQIATSHGRPRGINPEDCDVRPLTLEDFAVANSDSMLFLAYVDICSILADLTQSLVRGTLGLAQSVAIQSRLLNWIRDLPDCLRICDKRDGRLLPYNFKARQLNAMYCTAIMLLFRPASPDVMPSGATLLASSFSASIFEDFLARGELGCLAVVFCFHLMTAAYALLACYKYPSLWVKAEHELNTINKCLVEMAKKYPTAVGAQRVVKACFRAVSSHERHEEPLRIAPDPLQMKYFEYLGPDLCSKWSLVLPDRPERTVSSGTLGAAKNLDSSTAQPTAMLDTLSFPPPTIIPHSANNQSTFDPSLGDMFQGNDDLHESYFASNGAFTAVGNWMLGDWSADLDWVNGNLGA